MYSDYENIALMGKTHEVFWPFHIEQCRLIVGIIYFLNFSNGDTLVLDIMLNITQIICG